MMSSADEFSQFHKRLEDFESRLKKKTQQLEADISLSPDRRQSIDEFHAKSSALRRKLQETSQSSWGGMKKELETEWNILSHAFERWTKHVDTDFSSR